MPLNARPSEVSKLLIPNDHSLILITVPSPAPPVVALVGLLGILVGEQILPLAKSLRNRVSAVASWLHPDQAAHVWAFASRWGAAFAHPRPARQRHSWLK
jgi:xanthosine utilization system XapX-like protein